MENERPVEDTRDPREKLIQAAGKARTGCGCFTVGLAVLSGLIFLGIVFGSIGSGMRTLEVGGRVDSVQQTEQKESSGVIKPMFKVTFSFAFHAEEYTIERTLSESPWKEGEAVTVYLDPKNPKQASLKKKTLSDRLAGLLVFLLFLSIPVIISYGIYKTLRRIKIPQAQAETPSEEMPGHQEVTWDDADPAAEVTYDTRETSAMRPRMSRGSAFKTWIVHTCVTLLLMGGFYFFYLKNRGKMSDSQLFLSFFVVWALYIAITRAVSRRLSRARSEHAHYRYGSRPEEQPDVYDKEKKPAKQASRGTVIAVGLVMVLLAGGWGYLSYLNKQRGDRIISGMKVQGKVVSVDWKSSDSSKKRSSKKYYPVISYVVDGKEYRYRTRQSFITREFTPGDKVQLFYNPHDPEEVALDSLGHRDVYHGVTWLWPLLFSVLGFLIMRSGLKMKPRSSPRERPAAY